MRFVTSPRTTGRDRQGIVQRHGFPSDGDKAWIGDGGRAERESPVVRRLLDAGGKRRPRLFRSQHRGPGGIVRSIQEGVVPAMAYGTGHGARSKSLDGIAE